MQDRGFSKTRWFVLVAAISSIVSVIVGMKTLGCVLPTEAMAKKEAFTTFETKENAEKSYDRLDVANSAALLTIQQTLRDIDACLRNRTCGIVSEPAPH